MLEQDTVPASEAELKAIIDTDPVGFSVVSSVLNILGLIFNAYELNPDGPAADEYIRRGNVIARIKDIEEEENPLRHFLAFNMLASRTTGVGECQAFDFPDKRIQNFVIDNGLNLLPDFLQESE